ncbi:MAG: polysaccharide export protein [Salinisphaera sp.]|nr:polysaccharide export protein [Salinisphaera sp.]
MKRRTSYLSRLAGLWSILCTALILGIAAGGAQAQGYQIKPGDTLRIEVLEDNSLNRNVLVTPDGRISMPQAGTLRVSGQTVETVENELTQRIASNFAVTPNVFVSVVSLAQPREGMLDTLGPTISVFVMGEVASPGRLDVEPGTSVMQMFAMMGGFSKFAATKRIQLRRVDPQSKAEHIYRLNYNAIEAGAPGGRTILQDGDVLLVPQRKLFE